MTSQENLQSNSNDLITYDKLVDSEIKTNITTLDGNNITNPREKSGSIILKLENHHSTIIKTNNLSNSIFHKKNNEITNIIQVGIDESVIYNLNYKLKSAVNQINEFVKKINS